MSAVSMVAAKVRVQIVSIRTYRAAYSSIVLAGNVLVVNCVSTLQTEIAVGSASTKSENLAVATAVGLRSASTSIDRACAKNVAGGKYVCITATRVAVGSAGGDTSYNCSYYHG